MFCSSICLIFCAITLLMSLWLLEKSLSLYIIVSSWFIGLTAWKAGVGPLSPATPVNIMLLSKLMFVICVTLLLEIMFGFILDMSFCYKKLSAKSRVSVNSLTLASSLRFLSVRILCSFRNFLFSISHDFFSSTIISNLVFHLCTSMT